MPQPPGVQPVDHWSVHLALPDGEQVVEVPFDACDADAR